MLRRRSSRSAQQVELRNSTAWRRCHPLLFPIFVLLVYLHSCICQTLGLSCPSFWIFLVCNSCFIYSCRYLILKLCICPLYWLIPSMFYDYSAIWACLHLDCCSRLGYVRLDLLFSLFLSYSRGIIGVWFKIYMLYSHPVNSLQWQTPGLQECVPGPVSFSQAPSTY